MYIGEVAKQTGATPKAIRLYETLGLIPAPERRGRYRDFRKQDVELIRIIKQAQRLGFTLSEMKAMLRGETSCEQFPWQLAIDLVNQKIAQVAFDISRLERQRRELTEFVTTLSAKKCQDFSA